MTQKTAPEMPAEGDKAFEYSESGVPSTCTKLL